MGILQNGGGGVHVECTCPLQESAIPSLPLLTTGHDDDDVVDYLSTSKKLRTF